MFSLSEKINNFFIFNFSLIGNQDVVDYSAGSTHNVDFLKDPDAVKVRLK